jgi:hypothetical protein
MTTSKKSKVGLRNWVLFGILLVSTSLTVLLWLPKRPPNLVREARMLYDAVQSADGETLMRYAFPQEIEENNLTPAKLSKLFREIWVKRFQRMKTIGGIVTQDNGEQGCVNLEVEFPSGQRLNVGTSTYLVAGQAKAPILRHVFGAWMMEYFATHNEKFTLESRNRAVIEGLRKDGPFLKSLGIRSLSDINFPSGFAMVPLDQLDRRYEAWNASLARSKGP